MAGGETRAGKGKDASLVGLLPIIFNMHLGIKKKNVRCLMDETFEAGNVSNTSAALEQSSFHSTYLRYTHKAQCCQVWGYLGAVAGAGPAPLSPVQEVWVPCQPHKWPGKETALHFQCCNQNRMRKGNLHCTCQQRGSLLGAGGPPGRRQENAQKELCSTAVLSFFFWCKTTQGSVCLSSWACLCE